MNFFSLEISTLDELQFDSREQRDLSEQLYKKVPQQGSTVPYIVGLCGEYLTNTILIISSSLELTFF